MFKFIAQLICTHNWVEAYPTRAGRAMVCENCLKQHYVVDSWR